MFYIGLRSIDEPERKLLDKCGITYFTQEYIRKIGMDKTIEIINDQDLISWPFNKGQIAIIKKTIKKTIPKFLLDGNLTLLFFI